MARVDIKQPYKLLNKYDGMGPRDEVIWDSFVMQNPTAFDAVYYNFHLGNPARDENEEATMRLNGSYEVSQWCIDVLAYADGIEYVIEVKPHAGAGALGQAVAYTKLLQREGIIGENAAPVVLTDYISPITQEAADMLGVMLHVA